MDPEKKEHRLEGKGWKIGSAEDFPELTPQETALVELRPELADAVKLLRKDKSLTQTSWPTSSARVEVESPRSRPRPIGSLSTC